MGRDLAGFTGDSGLWLKHGIGTLVRHGALDSHRWPYDTTKFDEYPPPHLHGYADDFRAIKYFRLDSPTIPKSEHLALINKYLTEKWPVTTGFYCFESLNLATTSQTGEVPFPKNGEAVIGGHAIFLYGFDDDKVITNPLNGQSTKGAWKFRNSWGSWGSNGDGWLPYAYITDGRYGTPLADEFFTVTSAKWLNLQDFE
jgi:C1A family cysteine protease